MYLKYSELLLGFSVIRFNFEEYLSFMIGFMFLKSFELLDMRILYYFKLLSDCSCIAGLGNKAAETFGFCGIRTGPSKPGPCT